MGFSEARLKEKAAGFRLSRPAAFGGAMFLSALLLFSVQPLFAKMVLPRLGGAPGVWSVALVFFQGVLLAGYAYAHVIIRFLPPRAGAFLHVAVLASGALLLPIGLAEGWGRPPAENQVPWLIGLFGLSVGLPFFALSASAPLLQAWFSRGTGAHASDPYFLYGASNLGSFIALLGYPVLAEPFLRLGTQSWIWSAGYVAIALMVGGLGVVASRSPIRLERMAAVERVRASQCLAWTALAFLPSALLVAVTAHITTDIAAAPFLWVMPLALFLLTFVLVFRDPPAIRPALVFAILPILIGLAALDWLQPHLIPPTGKLPLHLVTFLVVALAAHTRLYAARPPASQLTTFYLFMSLGGVLGGVFAAICAPLLFPTTFEYPTLLVAAVALSLKLERIGRRQIAVAVLLAAFAAAFAALAMGEDAALPLRHGTSWSVAIVLMIIGALVAARRWPLAGMSMFAAALLIGAALQPRSSEILVSRSFFGVHKVLDFRSGTFRMLNHGTTLHGATALENGALPPGRPAPLTYYYDGGPMSETIRAMRQDDGGFQAAAVGVVGLGTGSLACYREPGERWHFYEIDTEIVKIARDSGLFRYVSACAPEAQIHIGDARLTLQDEVFKHRLLVIDAFSSDAIPTHLLTREAVQLYFDRLTPTGAVLLHVSNRHLDLVPVIGAIARELGLSAWSKRDVVSEEGRENLRSSSIVVVLARSDAHLARLTSGKGWEKQGLDDRSRAWTDDYSDVLGALLRGVRRGS